MSLMGKSVMPLILNKAINSEITGLLLSHNGGQDYYSVNQCLNGIIHCILAITVNSDYNTDFPGIIIYPHVKKILKPVRSGIFCNKINSLRSVDSCLP